MNDVIKEQNKRDLKKYRIIIALVFVSSLIIAFFVGLIMVDGYVKGAKFTNAIFEVIMPKTIEGETNEGDAQYTYGMVFYREKNKDFDPVEDEPLKAFNYYYLSEDGQRVDLEDGVYYPPEYYDEKRDVKPAQVYLGFYYKALENWNSVKKVMKVIAWIFIAVLAVIAIYIWYIVWKKREIAKHTRE